MLGEFNPSQLLLLLHGIFVILHILQVFKSWSLWSRRLPELRKANRIIIRNFPNLRLDTLIIVLKVVITACRAHTSLQCFQFQMGNLKDFRFFQQFIIAYLPPSHFIKCLNAHTKCLASLLLTSHLCRVLERLQGFVVNLAIRICVYSDNSSRESFYSLLLRSCLNWIVLLPIPLTVEIVLLVNMEDRVTLKRKIITTLIFYR